MSNAYDRDPKTGSSQFLRLKSKDESVVLRIASEPYREPKVWKLGEQKPMADENAANLTDKQWAAILREADYNVTEVFSWQVIDRADGKAKVFSGTPGVYKKIKAYAEQEQWGDPTEYDIQITRTEEPGPSYYDVMALPDKNELTVPELEAINGLDMSKLLPNARPSNEAQIDDLPEELSGVSAKDSPGKAKARATADKIKKQADEPEEEEEPEEDVVIEDIGEGPINLDDIPF